MFVSKDGVYIEYDLGEVFGPNYGADDSDKQLAYYYSSALWGGSKNLRKLKGIPESVERSLATLCAYGKLEKTLFKDPGSIGDASGHYMVHLYNDYYDEALWIRYFDDRNMYFDVSYGGSSVTSRYRDYVLSFKIVDAQRLNVARTCLGGLMSYCKAHDIGDVYIMADKSVVSTDGVGRFSGKSYIAKTTGDSYTLMKNGTYTLVCILDDIPMYDKLDFPVTSKSGVTYDEKRWKYSTYFDA